MPVCWLTVRPDDQGQTSRESLVTELAGNLSMLISKALNGVVGGGKYPPEFIEVRVRRADGRDRNIADLNICLEMLPITDCEHPVTYYDQYREGIAVAVLDWLHAKKKLVASLGVLKVEVRPRLSYGVVFADIPSRMASGSWGGPQIEGRYF